MPPGFVVDGETAGTEGPNPFFPDYQVHLRLTGGAAGEAERLDALDRRAQARGWAKVEDSTYGTYTYEYTRGFMTGVVDVRASGVEVIAGLPHSVGLWLTVAASRAVLPLAGVLIWWVVRWRLLLRV